MKRPESNEIECHLHELKAVCSFQTTRCFAQWQEVNTGIWILWSGERKLHLRPLCVSTSNFKSNVLTAGFEEIFWQLQRWSRPRNCKGRRGVCTSLNILWCVEYSSRMSFLISASFVVVIYAPVAQRPRVLSQSKRSSSRPEAPESAHKQSECLFEAIWPLTWGLV